MKGVDKAYAYAKLYSIKEEHNVDVSKYMKVLAESDSIPYEVIIFINKYYPIPQLATYNNIYEKRHNNPLYKNLVNESLPDEEKAVALASLLTRAFISAKMLEEQYRKEFSDIMHVELICEALCEYSNGDAKKLNEVFFMIRDLMKKLYN